MRRSRTSSRARCRRNSTMAAPCRPKIAPEAPTDGPGLVSMLPTLPAMPAITNRNTNWTRPNACSHTTPSTTSASALPTK